MSRLRTLGAAPALSLLYPLVGGGPERWDMDVFDRGKGSEMRMALSSWLRSGDDWAAAASYEGKGGVEEESIRGGPDWSQVGCC